MSLRRRSFAVTPPDMRVIIGIIALTMLITLLALGMAWRETGSIAMSWAIGVVAVIVPALLAVATLRRRIELVDDRLEVVAGLNRTSVPIAALDLAHARIADVGDRPENRVGIKMFGTSMPGYQAGHFRQIGGTRVFALVTGKQRVLVLPEHGGRLLMLSVERPQALLEALRAAA